MVDASPTHGTETPRRPWYRYFFYRKEVWKTTWTLRLSVLLLGIAFLVITWGFWKDHIAQSLICQEQIAPSDALLVENFDPDYFVFERAAALQQAGLAPRVFVPILVDNPEQRNSVLRGTVEVMARVSGLQNPEIIPIRDIEPITLNAAMQLRDFLSKENVQSVIAVSPAFRSKRSVLVYKKVMPSAGITVRCVPALATHTPQNWTETWHGIQDVGQQFLKLQYYRFWVLLSTPPDT